MKGTRLVCDVPHGHSTTTTFLATLRVKGLTEPLVIDGELSRGGVERHLAPTLRTGDIVIIDNLASHKVTGVRSAIEQAGAEIAYLSPYSPELNPTETAF